LEKEINKTRSIWITIFIYLSIFVNSIVLFSNPFEFYFGYLIYIILLPVFIFRFGLNRDLFYIFLILFVTGVFNIALGNNTAALFFKVFTGLTLSYFFYYYVILEYDFNLEQLFKWYLKGCYYAAIIGLIQFISFQLGFRPGYDFSWILNKGGFVAGGNFGIRVNSIFAEPTYLASTLSAAFFIAIYNLFRKENYYLTKFQGAVIILVYLLSFSGVGQLGIFLCFVFLAVNFGLIRYVIIAIPAGLILFNILYTNVKDFRERYDGLTGLFSGEEFKLGETHGSSFILYNNYQVTMKSFKDNFVFGTGIGSHPVSFDKYSLAKGWKVIGFNSNSADANSMLLRLISETGLFGVGLFLFIIFKCYVSRDPNDDRPHWLISNAILVMILLNLFRQGHYFLNGFPFFVILYYYNSVSYKMYLETGKDLYQTTIAEEETPAVALHESNK
jgi:hypothetical protein